MIDDLKIVEYDKFCQNCKYKKTTANDEPCEECLSNPVNINTHKPVNYEEKR